MPATPSNQPAPLVAFLDAFWRDVDNAVVQPLPDYLVRFPGDDAAIEREYRAAIGLNSKRPRSSAERSEDHLGPYRILREIGRGGQASVYLAEDQRLHRQVALKVLSPGHGIDEGRLNRFRREAEITSRLNNPGICPVYAAGEDHGVLWIAMAYVEGEPLASKISTAREHAASDSTSVIEIPERADLSEAAPTSDHRDEPPSWPKTWSEIARVLELFEEIARTLHVAHEHGVIHRDIKPGNIMVTEDGAPVILDFGLAQDIEHDLPTLTVTGDLLGTPAYVSPEQLAAQRIRLDRRTDVYSLGISLFECLTLRRPFEAPTRDALYQAILTREAPDLRSLNPAIPADLRVVVATAIEKDRNRRYHTALDLAEELRRVRMHEPIVAKPVGILVRLQRWAQRNRAAASLIVAITLTSVIGLWRLSAVSDALLKESIYNGARMQADILEEVNDFYSEIVGGLDPAHVQLTHDFADRKGSLPLPATFTIEAGRRISGSESGMQVRLYSDHPFPWRRPGGPTDDFERRAIEDLRRDPAAAVNLFETLDGRPVLRYARARVMKQSCVDCHNSRQDSPKMDWKVGDVRGVLEIIRPLDREAAQSRESLTGTFLTVFGGLGLALALCVLVLLASRR
jgi:eukaryotic-like serine/threonine-protein kinase